MGWLAGGAVGVVIGIVGITVFWSRPSDRGADADDRQLVALGQRVYLEHCASCHGENLEGQENWRERDEDGRLPAPPHDESGHTWHHADRVLFGIVKRGMADTIGMEGYESAMPLYEDVLSDAEIWSTLAYIKSTWPPIVRARQQEIDQRWRGQ